MFDFKVCSFKVEQLKYDLLITQNTLHRAQKLGITGAGTIFNGEKKVIWNDVVYLGAQQYVHDISKKTSGQCANVHQSNVSKYAKSHVRAN